MKTDCSQWRGAERTAIRLSIAVEESVDVLGTLLSDHLAVDGGQKHYQLHSDGRLHAPAKLPEWRSPHNHRVQLRKWQPRIELSFSRDPSLVHLHALLTKATYPKTTLGIHESYFVLFK